MDKFTNIIVGGGASGLFCASLLEKSGKDTLILEGRKALGRKLKIAGAGQCNFTNGGNIKEFISKYGQSGNKIRKVLYRFNNLKVREYFDKLGMPSFERSDGKVFPKSLVGQDVVDVLLRKIDKNHIKIKKNSKVISVLRDEENRNYWRVETENKEEFLCENLIIAVGGKSIASTGSDGKLIEDMVENRIVNISDLEPSLVPVFVENYEFEQLSGIAIKNTNLNISEDKKLGCIKGDLLFTHRNLSGPAILNSSRYIKSGTRFSINFLNDIMEKSLISLETLISNVVAFCDTNENRKKSVSNLLSYELDIPKKVLQLLLSRSDLTKAIGHIDIDKSFAELGDKKVKQILEILSKYPFVASGKDGFDKAMVTKGGISLKDMDLSTMKYKSYENLFFVGECLDVDGDTGGYNIQFAFSSGYVVAKYLESLNG